MVVAGALLCLSCGAPGARTPRASIEAKRPPLLSSEALSDGLRREFEMGERAMKTDYPRAFEHFSRSMEMLALLEERAPSAAYLLGVRARLEQSDFGSIDAMKSQFLGEMEERKRAVTDPLAGASMLALQLEQKEGLSNAGIISTIIEYYLSVRKEEAAHRLILSNMSEPASRAFALAKLARHFETEKRDPQRARTLYREAFAQLEARVEILFMFSRAVEMIATNTATLDPALCRETLLFAEGFLKKNVMDQYLDGQLLRIINLYHEVGLEEDATRLSKALVARSPAMRGRVVLSRVDKTPAGETSESMNALRTLVDDMEPGKAKADAMLALAGKYLETDAPEQAADLLGRVQAEAKGLPSYDVTDVRKKLVLLHVRNRDFEQAVSALSTITSPLSRVLSGAEMMSVFSNEPQLKRIREVILEGRNIGSKELERLAWHYVEMARWEDAVSMAKRIPPAYCLQRLDILSAVVDGYLRQGDPKSTEVVSESEALVSASECAAPAAGRLAAQHLMVGQPDRASKIIVDHLPHIGPNDLITLMAMLGDRRIRNEDVLTQAEKVARETTFVENRTGLLLAKSAYLEKLGELELAEAALEEAVRETDGFVFKEIPPLPPRWPKPGCNPDENMFADTPRTKTRAANGALHGIEARTIKKLPYYGLSLITEFARYRRFDTAMALISRLPRKSDALDMLTVVGIIHAEMAKKVPLGRTFNELVWRWDAFKTDEYRALLFGVDDQER